MTFLSIEESIETFQIIIDHHYQILLGDDQIIRVIKEESNINFEIEPSIILKLLLRQINYDFKRLDEIDYRNFPYLILHIRAGKAALTFINNFEISEHKVITKYMVRKKQGKAQYSYLTLKGKARGGAKLRLERTKEFFHDIIRKLDQWQNATFLSKVIFYQCTPRLWDMLFKTKLTTPFRKNDPRIEKIPFTTYKPSFKEIKRIKFYLEHSKISLSQHNDRNGLINYLEELLNNSHSQ